MKNVIGKNAGEPNANICTKKKWRKSIVIYVMYKQTTCLYTERRTVIIFNLWDTPIYLLNMISFLQTERSI